MLLFVLFGNAMGLSILRSILPSGIEWMALGLHNTALYGVAAFAPAMVIALLSRRSRALTAGELSGD